MKRDFVKLLTERGFKVELKGYKEMEARDGYCMSGNLYINGKVVYKCYDGGYGGECEIDVENKELDLKVQEAIKEINVVLSKEQDELVTKLRNEENKDEAIFKLLYDNGYSTYEYKLEVDKMFYQLADEYVNLKILKKNSKKAHLFSFKFTDEDNVNGYILYDRKYQMKSIYQAILKQMKEKNIKEVLKFDDMRMVWIKMDLNMIEKCANA